MVAALGLAAVPAQAETLYLLTENGMLATTSTTAPGANTAPIAITNVAAGETLVAIDVRPQTQKLYALGVNPTAETATLYIVTPETGFASPVSSVVSAIALTTDGSTPVDFPDPTTVNWDIDFNPSADRVRVVSGSLNFRINPNNGVAVDGDNGGFITSGVNPDGPINGGTTTVSATAYSNSQPNNGNITTQYTLDAVSNSLFIQSPPNAGIQTQVAVVTLLGSTLDFSKASFDIPPGVNAASSNSPASGSGFMVAQVSGTSRLYSLNLSTGVATPLGNLGLAVRSSAIRTELGAMIALSSDGASLIRFSPTTPGTTTVVAISTGSVVSGETLVGMDFRPQTGQIMALGVNPTANSASLYLVDPQTGAVTLIGAASGIQFTFDGSTVVDLPDPATSGYGIDFNPTVDRLRVVTSNGFNFRVNPNNGAPIDGNFGQGAFTGTNPDGLLSGNGVAGLDAVAYTNSFAQSLTGGVTTQYTLDAATNTLYIQNPPNSGGQTLPLPLTLNGAAVDITSRTGFDLPASVSVAASNTPATGDGWLVATVGGTTGLYRIDLATGALTSFGALGAGSTAVTGFVALATAPELDVEAPAGIPVLDNLGTVDFSTPTVGTPSTATIKLVNRGSQPLSYTAATLAGTEFTVTSGASGTIPGSSSVNVVVTFSPTGEGQRGDTLTILSTDSDEASFEVALAGLGYPSVAADEITVTGTASVLSPLANDGLSVAATIDSVSEPTVTIDGRNLVIPAGYTGSFTYLAADGVNLFKGTVNVVAGTPVSNPTSFNGLLFASNGDLVGWANTTISAKGVATVLVRGGANTVSAKITIPTGGNSGSFFTKLGNLTITRSANGTVALELAALGGDITGTLRPARTTAPVQKHHIALAGLDPTLPGGGYLIANVSAKGAVTMAGVLPDGLPFTGGTALRDNGSIAFYSIVSKGKPPGLVGGELVTANLAATDVTGELLYSKLPQTKGALGVHLTGVEATLTANGCLYSGVIPLAGAGTLTLDGGGLMASSDSVTVSAKGIPTVPTGALKAWTGVSPALGKFTIKVAVPGVTKQVTGSGIYLPKTNSAWGFFPGLTTGGRVELTVP